MNVLYDVKEVEQVSNIRFWVQTGSTSERGPDSAHVNFRGISDDHGRLMVVMAHNTDIPTRGSVKARAKSTSTASRRTDTPSASTSSCTD